MRIFDLVVSPLWQTPFVTQTAYRRQSLSLQTTYRRWANTPLDPPHPDVLGL
jgi:hypothetical protein